MSIIEDGAGTGYKVQVDKKNRIRTYSVVEDEPTFINRVEKEMYSSPWTSSGITAATGGNWIVYVKNTSTSKDMVVVTLKHRVEDTGGSLSSWLNVIGTPGGTLATITPANRNAGSNNEASCDYYTSTNITGLSGGRKVGSVYGKVDEEFEYGKPCSGWILPPNSTLGIKADNNTAKHFGGLAFYFRDKF